VATTDAAAPPVAELPIVSPKFSLPIGKHVLFRLLRDATLRQAVSNYYAYIDQTRERIAARRTAFPSTVASMIPAEVRRSVRNGGVPDPAVSQQLIVRIREPRFGDLLSAEEHCADFLEQMLDEERHRAEGLLQLLEQALGEGGALALAVP